MGEFNADNQTKQYVYSNAQVYVHLRIYTQAHLQGNGILIPLHVFRTGTILNHFHLLYFFKYSVDIGLLILAFSCLSNNNPPSLQAL
jgi:hypothetical protein